MIPLTDYSAMVAGCPCDGCPQRARCAREKLACTDFQYWTNHGGHEKPRRAVPTRAVFAQIFNQQDSSNPDDVARRRDGHILNLACADR